MGCNGVARRGSWDTWRDTSGTVSFSGVCLLSGSCGLPGRLLLRFVSSCEP